MTLYFHPPGARARELRLKRFTCTVAAIVAICASPLFAGQTLIRTDGSLGPRATLGLGAETPRAFVIPQSAGRLVGQNLFHSFEAFSVGRGDAAIFTTQTASLANVVSRVTGPTPSFIEGLVALRAAPGSKPNFYLINPNGIAFGGGAQIDMPGAFHASTARELRFADGSVFRAGNSAASTLSIASPQSFGFLGNEGGIAFFGGGSGSGVTHNLSAALVDISAPRIDLAGSSLLVSLPGTLAPSAARILRLVTVHGRASIPVNGLPSIAATGTIEMRDSVVQVGGIPEDVFSGDFVIDARRTMIAGVIAFSLRGGPSGGALVAVKGSTVALSDALIAGSSTDSIDLMVQADHILLDRSEIFLHGQANGKLVLRGGDIHIVDSLVNSLKQDDPTKPPKIGTEDVEIQADDLIIDRSSITTASAAEESGRVLIEATRVSLVDSEISSANMQGAAGRIDIRAREAVALDRSRIDSGVDRGGFPSTQGADISIFAPVIDLTDSAISSTTGPGPFANARGGDIRIAALDASLNRSALSTQTLGSGSAGDVIVRASGMLLDASSIVTDTGGRSTFDEARAGNVRLALESLKLTHEAIVSSSTSSASRAGDIAVSVSTLDLDGSAFTAESISAGSAGKIAINALDAVSLRNGASISTDAAGTGKAGDIILTARTVLVDPSNISSRAGAMSSGQPGNITLTASEALTIAEGSKVTIENAARIAIPQSGRQAGLTVTAPRIELLGGQISAASTADVGASNVQVVASERLTMRNAGILTTAQDGNGGSVQVNGGHLITMDHSQISASVLGSHNGNGGDISVTVPLLVMNTGFVQANTTAPQATGGNVAVNIQSLIAAGVVLVNGLTPLAFDSSLNGINVIQAAAPGGVSGNVRVAAPVFANAGSLRGLSTELIGFGGLGKDLCRSGASSSLTPLGRGGLRPTSAGWVRPEGTVAVSLSQARTAQRNTPLVAGPDATAHQSSYRCETD